MMIMIIMIIIITINIVAYGVSDGRSSIDPAPLPRMLQVYAEKLATATTTRRANVCNMLLPNV